MSMLAVFSLLYLFVAAHTQLRYPAGSLRETLIEINNDVHNYKKNNILTALSLRATLSPSASASPLFWQNLLEVNIVIENASIDLSNFSRYDPDDVRYVLRKVYNVSEFCLNDTSRVYLGVVEKEMWAIKVIDANAKFETGVLTGNVQWLGSYTECLQVADDVPPQVSSADGKPFTTKYCKVFIGNSSQQAAFSLRIDSCVPSSCSEADVQGLVNSDLLSVLPADIEVLSVDCLKQDRKLNSSATVVVVLLSCLGVVLLVGTGYDVLVHRSGSERQPADSPPVSDDAAAAESSPLLTAANSNVVVKTEDEKPAGVVGRLLLALSLRSNALKLLQTGHPAEGTLQAVHGVRFFSMTWVMLGHVYVFIIAYTRNPTFVLTLMKRWTFQTIFNATVSVDSFFLLSGTLVSYLLLKEMKKVGGPRKINWVHFYVHRYWRLTPAYMVLIAVWADLFMYLGNGPLWADAGPDPNCKPRWWLNLLYINNMIPQKDACMGWAWYLANDVQFFIISPLFLVPLYLCRSLGLAIISVVLCSSLIATGVISYDHNFPAGNSNVQNADPAVLIQVFDDMYTKPWCRIGPYLIGILLGYVLQSRERWARLPRMWVVLGWAIATASNLAVLYGLSHVAQGHPASAGVAAFYNAVSRTVWGVGLAWVVFACVTGHAGFVNSLLSWRPLVPLSRLTYMAYLIHPMVFMYFYSTREQTIAVDDMMFVVFFLGLLVMTYGFAFCLSLVLESPLLGVEKVVVQVWKDWRARLSAPAPTHSW